MVKNRIIAVLMWAFFLAWVYGRNRITEEEHLRIQTLRTTASPQYIDFMKEFEEMLESDPKAKASYYEYLYEVALEEIEETA